MSNEPAGNQQSHSQQNRDNGKPIPSGPPKRQQKADSKDDTSNLASHDIEAAEDEQSTNDRRSQITCWQG